MQPLFMPKEIKLCIYDVWKCQGHKCCLHIKKRKENTFPDPEVSGDGKILPQQCKEMF